ncbi:MAG: carbohydrate kinase family protein [Dehalococcoidales bacterium]|nr:carbohydrate kinase family protein [Dehalococcoidales bacterium]
MSNIQVVGLGAMNMDYIYRVESILGDGETTDLRKYKDEGLEPPGKFPGGSAANTIYGLARLGVKTGFIGAIGDDDNGRALLQDLKKAGVDTTRIRVKSGVKTGRARCLIDKANFRSIQVTPGANILLTMDDLDLEYLNQAEILHMSSFAGNRQFKILLELMGKLDSSVKVSFAPGALYAAKGLKALAPILNRTHVLFTNQNEIRQLTGMNFETGTEECLKLGCRMIVVTFGRGLEIQRETPAPTRVTAVSYIRDAQAGYIIEVPDPGELVSIDTIGAGDAFAAGFLYGLLRGRDPRECGVLGDITARFSTTKVGARQGLPAPGELSGRYREISRQSS